MLVGVKLTLLRYNRPEVFCKKDDLNNFVKFTGKRLSRSFVFNKLTGGLANY